MLFVTFCTAEAARDAACHPWITRVSNDRTVRVDMPSGRESDARKYLEFIDAPISGDPAFARPSPEEDAQKPSNKQVWVKTKLSDYVENVR